MERIEPIELPNSEFQRIADVKINEIIEAFNDAIDTIENLKIENDALRDEVSDLKIYVYSVLPNHI